MKIAVITPYYKEDDSILMRCIESVNAQTVPCVHYLVADGLRRDWAEGLSSDTRKHITLSEPHRDYGNTPRGIGGLLAVAEGAEAVAFLDADNTMDRDHLETCAALATGYCELDYVVARRRLVLPDGTVVPGNDEPAGRHVDTNCYFLLKGAFRTLPHWVFQPRQLSIIGDRLFLRLLQGLQLTFAVTSRPTVNYTSDWQVHYMMAGRVPPPSAKSSIDTRQVSEWWQQQQPAERDHIRQRLGMPGLEI